MTQLPDRSDRRLVVAIALWIAAIAMASMFDRAIAVWVHNSGLQAWMDAHDGVAQALKTPGLYYFTLAVVLVVTLVHPLGWRAGGFMLLATLVSGLNGLIKWMVGRTRPFKLSLYDSAGHARAAPFVLAPFRGGLRGIVHEMNLSFPSGHAALAFATAAALAMLWPRSRWRWVAYVVAAIVAFERVAENAHWLSDTVGAAALGVGGVYLIHWLLMRLLPAGVTGKASHDPAA